MRLGFLRTGKRFKHKNAAGESGGIFMGIEVAISAFQRLPDASGVPVRWI
jgi:hypothetical protein